MLTKLAKRIQKEINQAEDYCTQAFLIKHEDEATAKLFIDLAGEEIDHAKRLLEAGVRLIDAKNPHVLSYERKTAVETEDEHFKECKISWKWENRIAMEAINEITYKLSQFRTMP